MHGFITTSLDLLAQAPNPGQGAQPPGGSADNVRELLSWVMWLALSVCVIGVIAAGGAMAIAHRGHGGGNEHAARLGWVLGGCIVVGSASGMVNALI